MSTRRQPLSVTATRVLRALVALYDRERAPLEYGAVLASAGVPRAAGWSALHPLVTRSLVTIRDHRIVPSPTGRRLLGEQFYRDR